MKQRQLLSWINSTWLVSMEMGQFCRITAPFQPLTDAPSYITALYAKNDQAIGQQYSLSISHVPHKFVPVAVTSSLWIIPSNPKTLGSTITIICPDEATGTVLLQQPFHILRLSPACSATSRVLLPPPPYEDHTIMMNASLDTANIDAINISTLDFRIWQHFNSNWTSLNTSEPGQSFTIKDDDQDPSLIWTILTHPGVYMGLLVHLPLYVCVHCLKRFWFRPATPSY